MLIKHILIYSIFDRTKNTRAAVIHGLLKLENIMCTTRAKLKEVENEMDCLYAELRSIKVDRDKAVNETKIAEDNHDRVCQRNMRLRETADISILWMITGWAFAAICFAGWMLS